MIYFGGGVLMLCIRESFLGERVAAVAVRLRFSMGEMLGTGSRLCQLSRFAAMPARARLSTARHSGRAAAAGFRERLYHSAL